MHYCGDGFAIDVAADETLQTNRLSSPLYPGVVLISEKGRFGIYEPEPFDFSFADYRIAFREYLAGEGVRLAVPGLGSVRRFKLHYDESQLNGDQQYGYAREDTVGEDARTLTFLSSSFTGQMEDLAWLSRVRTGSPQEVGCQSNE